MPRTPLAALAALCLSALTSAQGITPMGQVHPAARKVDQVAQVAVPALDRPAIAAEDERRQANREAPRYAIPFAVDARPATHGTWETLDAAWSLWRLRVVAPGASHVNLGFTNVALPPTARLMVCSTDYQNVVRPFDRTDVSPEGELWTPVVTGEQIVAEVYLQTAERPLFDLRLAQIGSGYRFFGAGGDALGLDGSGACNVDVACPSGAAWLAEIPTVAAISTGGSVFCTGFMVNNTAQDGRNFFMTANHCGITSGSAASLVCYWNYQRAVCGSGSGPMTMFNTGSTFRASWSTSDFTLVELNSSPNPAWGITHAGWNRGAGNATWACAIHHPSGDVKKISFENQATTTTSYLGTAVPGDGTHVRVIDWDSGTTEPGSSGSPLFDQDHRVIGQLHGGYAACGNNDSDWYGRFSLSWTGGGTSSTRLSNWLDPLNTGLTVLDTRGTNAATAAPYGTGCYSTYASFYEHSGVFDLSGTATTTVSILFTPSGSGYVVSSGPNSWYAPTSANLGLGDDQLTSTRSLPFTFVFPGGATSGVRMCSNGFVWLNGTSTSTDYTPTIEELCANPARFAVLWADLNPATAGTTHFDIDPGNTAVYCTWLGVPAYGAGTTGNTAQLVLRSTGAVEFRYRAVANLPAGALVGWSPGNGAAVPPMTDLSAALPFSVGLDATGLTLGATGRPLLGTTMSLDLSNIPAGTLFGCVIFGWTKHGSGLSLSAIGMPGCFQYCSQEFSNLIVATNPTASLPFAVPSSTVWSGIRLQVQGATLSAGFNALGALSSNGIELLFNPN